MPLVWKMGAFIVRSADGKLLQPCSETSPHGVFFLLRAGGVSIESVPKGEIEDKSKTDGFSRAFACLQISWLIIQLIGRAVQHLPISTFELLPASSAACAVVSYVIWWNKPKDVAHPIVLQSTFSYQEIQDRKNAFNDSSRTLIYPRRHNYIKRTIASIAVLLASVSILGWSFTFATFAEQLAWRILSILLPILAIAFFFVVDLDSMIESLVGATVHSIIIISLMILYAIARLYFIVEVFTGLRSSPPALYSTVNWSLYFPHL
jgi:hypothetical protein